MATAAPIPSNDTFAEEIKTDRLRLLNYFTIIVSTIVMVMLLTFGTLANMDAALNVGLMLAVGITLLGCWLSNYLLNRVRFDIPAWLFIISPSISMTILMMYGGQASIELIPFVFPLLVFIGGLLLSPTDTAILAILSSLLVAFAPGLGSAGVGFIVQQGFAILLILVAAGLAALVTGELYQVTQWALENYSRQRRTNVELFDKREELKKSLLRAEVLGERLMETNEDLEQAKADAEEAKHFRGQFLANMSHELRTPLNAIIGFSETMLNFPIMYDNEPLPDAYKDDLAQIYNSGRQLLHVINDILDLARVDAGKLEIHMQEVNAMPIINAVSATAKGLLGNKPVELVTDLPENMPTVNADETRLRQVLLNLYSNACKYTDEGAITLTVKHIQPANEIQFSLADTGIGIDPEFHSTLFEEFEQAKSGGRDPRAGSGLGLAISRQLLELMDGRIWMQSTPGVGSTFSFTVKVFEDLNIRDNDATEPLTREGMPS
ncbi:MAG: ATP-binding protein [Chloroflexota bacterium]